ncbi:CBS domain-containing protein [Natronococcus wangiae]|uniref:CBS domain-containing protein n=1 Tax=Natronococcus wangiae TaxID=3068275 RepID=UPI00273D942B|nr:CBS domain-containing protein [Natronococcus sp. AD5]
MPIENLARRDVITASPDESVHELATTMREEDVGSIVITDGETPVGIVTDRDLTMQVLAEQADPGEMAAEDVMSEELRTIQRDAGFYEATELMSRYGIRRVPVTDADDQLTGIITADDLSELLADEQQELADVVRAQRPPY